MEEVKWVSGKRKNIQKVFSAEGLEKNNFTAGFVYKIF
jgi:hypothetical protein